MEAVCLRYHIDLLAYYTIPWTSLEKALKNVGHTFRFLKRFCCSPFLLFNFVHIGCIFSADDFSFDDKR